MNCVAECARVYNESILDCPCNQFCPEGCPCPNYNCPSDKVLDHVLVMHDVNKASVINTDGLKRDLRWDSSPEVDEESFCSLQFQNEFYIFGQA